jgi:hypothetical protein
MNESGRAAFLGVATLSARPGGWLVTCACGASSECDDGREAAFLADEFDEGCPHPRYSRAATV